MRYFYVFWNTINWLEFVTYIIIPTAIITIILTYIFFNLRLIKMSIEDNAELLNNIEDMLND